MYHMHVQNTPNNIFSLREVCISNGDRMIWQCDKKLDIQNYHGLLNLMIVSVVVNKMGYVLVLMT